MGRYNLRKNCCLVPQFIHLELTKRCPLKCKQCYVHAEKKEDLDWDRCKSIIRECADIGVERVLLTGGEPLLYKHIIELIELINSFDMKSVISTSAYNLDKKMARELKRSNVHNIFVSLNGSTKEIHNLSRSNFEESIKGIKNLVEEGVWCGINWVVRKDNIKDFNNLLRFSKELKVNQVNIISPKKDSSGNLENISNKELEYLADIIKDYRKEGYVSIDLCFPELNYILLKEKMHPVLRYCIAGRYFIDINTEGKLSPCRHIEKYESFNSIKEYWDSSNILKDIRQKMKNNCR